MSERDLPLNGNERRQLNAFHGVPSGSSTRQRFKIDVPPQGAVSNHNHAYNNRRSARGIPKNNLAFSDTLYGASSEPSSSLSTRRNAQSIERPNPKTRGGLPLQSVPKSPVNTLTRTSSAKGKARQEELDVRSSYCEPTVISIDSDEEKSRLPDPQKPLGNDWLDNTASVASNSKALDAKDRRRRQGTIHRPNQDLEPSANGKGQRRSRPIPLEEPSDSRSSSSRHKVSLAAQRDRPSSIAARMKPKVLPSDTPHPANEGCYEVAQKLKMDHNRSSTNGKKVADWTIQPRPADTIKSPLSEDDVRIDLQRIVISDVWRSAERANLFIIVKNDGIDVRRREEETLFTIHYTDVSLLECTKQDVREVGLISVTLKPNSASVTEVQSHFRQYDPRASADACEILMVASVDIRNLLAQQKVAQRWANLQTPAIRWLDLTASKTKIAISNNVRAAPWPKSGSSSVSNNMSPLQSMADVSRPKRELVLPGTDRMQSLQHTKPERSEMLVPETQMSPDQSGPYRKAFDIYSQSFENALDIAGSPPLPEPDSPPLRSLNVPSKNQTSAPIRNGLRSRITKDAHDPIVQYPFEGIGAVTLLESDLRRLDDGELLNDTVIEFALKLMHEDIRMRDPRLAESIYIFNTFFYKILTESKEMESSYNKVRKWTSKTDLFSKKFIVVPINEDLHWYLALIVNPWSMLQSVEEKALPVSATEVSTPEQRMTRRMSAVLKDDVAPETNDATDSASPSVHVERESPDAPNLFGDLASAVSDPTQNVDDIAVVGVDAHTTPPDSTEKFASSSSNASADLGLKTGVSSALVSPIKSALSSDSGQFPFLESRRSPMQSPRRFYVEDRRSSRPAPVWTGQTQKKPTHIKFDDIDDSDWSIDHNGNSASANASPIVNRDPRRSGTLLETRMDVNLPEVDESRRAGFEARQSRKRATGWSEESAPNDSFASDRSIDTMDGEEIRRVSRGRLEGGGPAVDPGASGLSPSMSKSRTRILPGDGRRDSNQAVGAASFYTSLHGKQKRAEREDAMDVDSPEPNNRKTRRKSLASSSEPGSLLSPHVVEVDMENPSDATGKLESCFVITLDSLGLQHKNVAKQLREYLWREAIDKEHLRLKTEPVFVEKAKEFSSKPNKPPKSFPEPVCIQSQVPQQPNFCDCGIYLLHYFDRFFSDPNKSLQLAINSAKARVGKRRNKEGNTLAEQDERLHWQAGTVQGKRQYWRSRALQLSEGWQEFQERRKEERALQQKQVSEDSLKPEDEADSMEIEQADLLALATGPPRTTDQSGKDSAMDIPEPSYSKNGHDDDHGLSGSSAAPAAIPDHKLVLTSDPSFQPSALRSRSRSRLSSCSLRREGSSDAVAPSIQDVHLVSDSEEDNE